MKCVACGNLRGLISEPKLSVLISEGSVTITRQGEPIAELSETSTTALPAVFPLRLNALRDCTSSALDKVSGGITYKLYSRERFICYLNPVDPWKKLSKLNRFDEEAVKRKAKTEKPKWEDEGKRLKARREKLALSQSELARRLYISNSTISRCEAGKADPTTYKQLLQRYEEKQCQFTKAKNT